MMLLRRITQHVREQNWLAVSIDFAIVVIGVFIGIQVANWNDARGDRALETEYVELLTRDLQALQNTLDSQVSWEQGILDVAGSALDQINNRETQDDSIILGKSLSSLWGRRTLTLTSPTFIELQGAGRITLITNSKLRNQLISYFDTLARTERVIANNNNFLAEPYTDFLRRSGIGIVMLSSEECAQRPQIALCYRDHLLSKTFGSQKTDAANTVLNRRIDDPFWDEVRAQVVMRAAGARGNQINAQDALDRTLVMIELLQTMD